MKNILVIAENSKVIEEIVNQVKLNVPCDKLHKISNSGYEAKITSTDFKLRIVLKEKEINDFAYDVIHEFTFNSILETLLFGMTEALAKDLSPKESPLITN